MLKNRKSPQRTYQERSPVGVDGRKRRSFSEAKEVDMRRTGAPHAATGATLRTRSGHVKLRNRRHTKSKGRTRKVASSGLLLHHAFGNRKELRHLQQRTISRRKIPPTLENIPCWSTSPNSHPH